MGKKSFKIYFHKHFYHQPQLPLKTGFWKKLKTSFLRILEIFVFGFIGLSYLVGEWIIYFFQKIFRASKNEIIKTTKHFKLRSKLFFSKNLLANSSGLVLGAFCIVLLLGSFRIFANGLELKRNVLTFFSHGQLQLKDAQKLLTSSDPSSAFLNFSKAYKNFLEAQNQINNSGAELKILISVLPEGTDGKKIIEASSLLSKTGGNALNFYTTLKNLKLTAEGISSSEQNKEIISKSLGYLNETVENLKKADSLLSGVNLSSVPKDQQAQFLEVAGQVKKSSEIFSVIQEIFNLFAQSLLKSSNILLIMENNNELRPGGGFIGSFAAIKQSAGKISKVRLGSIYDLDGQLTEKIAPPLPILAVNERWYLRDSNWFSDFPASAKKITEFYEKEGGETPDIIIALTPNIIVDLLQLTGPVEVPKYNVTLTPENFVERTQVLTTMSDETPENQPKQFLADLMPILLQRLGELDFSKFDGLLNIAFTNLTSKQLIFYSRDSYIQSEFEKFNWSGQVLDSDRDYLQIVSSNLGGTKSDLFIEQSLKLSTKIDSDGSVTNELNLNFKNNLPDLEYTKNTRFIRILVPKNSKLVSVSGFDYKNIEPLDDENIKRDPDALSWDSSMVKDVITGTLIGEESGKTFFGNWITLKGGQTRAVKIVYKLPFVLQNLDHYNLLMQKQAGANSFKTEYDLNFDGYNILWKSFDENFDVFTKTSIKSELNQDRFWGMVVSK